MENYGNIRCLLADIDGTLAEKGDVIMPLTRKALIEMHNRGVKIGLASGRPYDHRIRQKAKQWDLPFEFDCIIGMNGGDLWVQGEEEARHYHLLQPESIRKVMQILEGMDLTVMAFRNGYDDVICTKLDDYVKESMGRNHSHMSPVGPEEFWAQPLGKVEVHYEPEQEEELMKRVEANPDEAIASVITFPGTLEFQDPRNNKGVGVKAYAEIMGFAPEEILAFGDMDNDIELLKEAGTGVCLLNGSDTTKAAADVITEYSVKEDGVGHWLYDHVLHPADAQ